MGAVEISQVAGRIAAIHDRAHEATHGDRAGFIGFFETTDEPAVAGTVVAVCVVWLGRQAGYDSGACVRNQTHSHGDLR